MVILILSNFNFNDESNMQSLINLILDIPSPRMYPMLQEQDSGEGSERWWSDISDTMSPRTVKKATNMIHMIGDA